MSYHQEGVPIDGYYKTLFQTDTDPIIAQTCFFCSKRDIGYLGAFVHWRGNADIFLHPECAKNLALHLAKDGLMASYQVKASGEIKGSI